MMNLTNVRWQFSSQGWYMRKQDEWTYTFKILGDIQLLLQKGKHFPHYRGTDTLYSVPGTSWGSSDATFSSIMLLLSWVAETPHSVFRGTSLFWRSICCVVTKICWHSYLYPQLLLAYSKMHSKIFLLSISLSSPSSSLCWIGWRGGRTQQQQLPPALLPLLGELSLILGITSACGAREISPACPSAFLSIMLVPGLPGRQPQFSSPTSKLTGGTAAPFLHM